MPAWIRTLVVTVLLVGTVTGWAAAIFLGTQVLPTVQQDDADLAAGVRSFVEQYVEVQKAADEYEKLTPFLAGPALEAMQREADAGAQPVGSLAFVSGDFEVIWRSGNQAMIAGRYTLESNAAKTEVGEHYLMQMVDGRWKIVQRFRLQIDPGTPIVAGDEEPSPSAAPAESQQPAESQAPAESEAPAASDAP